MTSDTLGHDLELPPLPFSGKVALVSELTGVEEDLLTDKKKMEDGRAFNHVTANCTQFKQEDGTWKRATYEDIAALRTCDRLALMLGVRRVTFGPELEDHVKCFNPDCGKHFAVSLSLDGVTNYPTKREVFDDQARYEFVLKDGTKIVCQLLTFQSERFIAQAPEDERLTASMQVALVSVTKANGQKLDDNDRRRWLRTVSMRVRQEIREGMEQFFFGPDTSFEAPCPHCGTKNRGGLEQLAGFFFPGVGKKMTSAS